MTTSFLSVSEGRLAYDDTGGAGPLVLAVPGMGDVRAVYRFLTPALVAAGYRVVTMDVRGHGESSVGWSDHSAAAVGADILALLRHLDAGPARLLGGSMAAAAALWVAAEAPERVAGLVLLGPFARDVPQSLLQRLAGGLMTRIVGTFPGAWARWYARLYPTSPPADLDDYRRALTANLREPGRAAALQAMLTASKADCWARSGEVSAPTLVVMGTKDPDFSDPAAEAELVAQRLGGRVLLVEGAGHYPHAELPEVLAPQLLDFFAEADHDVA